MTIRPTWPTKWGASLFLIGIAALFLALGIRDWVLHGYDLWAPASLAVIIGLFGVATWRMFIRADDSSIAVGLVWTRRYARQEVTAMRIGRFRLSYYTGSGRRVTFLRPDGSVVFSTLLYWWGIDQLGALAAYLHIPVEVP